MAGLDEKIMVEEEDAREKVEDNAHQEEDVGEEIKRDTIYFDGADSKTEIVTCLNQCAVN